MILSNIILGAVVAAGVVGVVAAFWNDLIDFLKRSVQKIMGFINGILYGSKVFIKKLSEGVEEISRHYSKVDNVWEETTVRRTVPESEIPPEILERAKKRDEIDITNELELQLVSA